MTFTGAEIVIADYLNSINTQIPSNIAVAVDSSSRVRIDTILKGSGASITLDGSQSANIVTDVFSTATPTEIAGTDDTTGTAPIGLIDIIIPPNALDTDPGIRVENPIGGVSVSLLADGSVMADGLIRTSASDLLAPAGDVNVGYDVISQGGNIEAQAALPNGTIESVNGDVVAGNDITAGNDIEALNDIVSSLGDIKADQGEVQCGVDFTYYVAKSYKYTIPLSSGQSNFDVTADEPMWLFDPVAGTGAPLWQSNASIGVTGADKAVQFGFRLPNGCVLDKVTAILKTFDAVVTTMTVEKRSPVWTPGSGAYGSNTILGTANNSLWGSGITDALQVDLSPNETIDENDHYYVTFSCPAASSPTVHLYAVRLEFTTLYNRP